MIFSFSLTTILDKNDVVHGYEFSLLSQYKVGDDELKTPKASCNLIIILIIIIIVIIIIIIIIRE